MMLRLIRTLVPLGLLCSLIGVGPALAQQADTAEVVEAPCGDRPVAVARMQWPSAAVLAHIHAQILRIEFGCDSQVVAGDLAATTSSMASAQQPAIAPELWLTRIPDIWNAALESQNVRQIGDTFSGAALEGWFIPDFVAANHPDLKGAQSLKDYVGVFTPEGGKARFISCPPDWACALINRNLLKALGLADDFEIVEPENRFALDKLIGEAMSSKEPIVFYYWQPNPVLSQFGFRQLDLGAYDADALKCLATQDCAVPEPSAFPSEPVVIALSDWVLADLPRVVAYFQKARMPLAEMNQLLAWQSETASGAEEAALHFIATRREVWEPWVGSGG